MHSFTFVILITVFFALFFPIVALPFFLGYSLHLFADSLTIEGIKPFYPYKKRVCGRIKSGGRTEISIFLFFIFANLLLLFFKIFNIF